VHILFLSDNFPPETNAPASRTYEHARRWVAAGHQVTVITGAPNFPSGVVHPGYRNSLWSSEVMDGVSVLRVWTYITANEGFARRALDYLSFMVTATLASLFVKTPDVIVATSPQFFTPCGGWVVSLLRRRPFVFELRDLWPDSIVAVGAMRETRVIRWLRKLEYFLYRRAARIICVTHSFQRVITGNGIDPRKIAVVTNGVDANSFVPGPKPDQLERRMGLQGRFVVAYVGTVGMAHGIGTLLDAARLLKSRTDIAFVVVGTGAEHRRMTEEVCRDGLSNVIFVGAVGKQEVRDYWKLCDVAAVLLRDSPVFRHVIPSKMFEAMGTGKPIVLAVRGESEEILSEAGAGIAVLPEDPQALAAAIRHFADNRELGRIAGGRGREYVCKNFDRDALALRMLSELEVVAEAHRQAPRFTA
jgi:glycosyltransferase involved in cell wall biosynthesis